MKSLIISALCMFLFSTFSVQAAMPNEKSQTEKTKYVNAKCHVALIDGSDTIIYYHINSDKFSKLANEIVGKRVLTQKSIKKIKIYRVHECALDEDDFTSTKSKSLDKKIER